MAKVSAKLDAQMKAKQMKQPPQEVVEQLSLKALEQFVISDSINIVEDDEGQLKVVRLFDKDQNPIYFLVSQKLGAGAFGEVSYGIQLDIKNSTIIPDTEVAIKITDYSEGGTIGRKDLDSAREETEHEYDILSRIQQSKGFSLGERVKNVKLEFVDGLSVERVVTVHEAVVAMTLIKINTVMVQLLLPN